MWQRCLHTFHFASSFWRFQRSPDHSLSNPASSYRYYGSQGEGGGRRGSSLGEASTIKMIFNFSLKLGKSLSLTTPTPKIILHFLSFSLAHILSSLHPHIKNRRCFQRPGCFIFFGQGNHFLSSNYFISYENFG